MSLFKMYKKVWFSIQVIILVTQLYIVKVSSDIGPDTVIYQLFTRKNVNEAYILQLNNFSLLEQSNYNKSLPTKIFAHGWGGFPDQGYSSKDEYLLQEDCNFISVDWSVLAEGDHVTVSLINVPIAGAATGAFVDFLIGQGTPLSAFHLIGFSMGAHVVGNAGAAVASGILPRITGLDPASDDFPLDSIDNRLDTTDAFFVDIIHTYVAFVNMTGHADFYPNGGLIQAGCPVPDLECCNHCRVVDLYAESINSPLGFNAFQCDSWENYQNGDCQENVNTLMGEPVSINVRGSFFLATNRESPFAQG
ncbi:hypothetical protein OUZ56_022267 [Daphnia magna]|uniref:Lipase domain-containing protein n=1 Tax=Daphnia magna TaxID=35525 RepID=A0ABR0AVY4_9CRUS|nr:hypothetical protein OUZ56_022267 [Daphnia magna]